MKVLIKITKEVLERSKMCMIEQAASNCAISIAIIDLFPQARTYQFTCNLLGDVDCTDVDCTDMDSVTLPFEATSFIKRFDNSVASQRVLMTPFSFEIEVPEYVIEKIGLNHIYKVLSESKSMELVMQDIG